jgi:membrane protease YdiL (CAAX protease family)
VTSATNRILGGFADPPPEALASGRHLRRLLYIVLGIAIAMLVQARKSASTPAVPSRIPLYLALIAVEFCLVWFVAIGIRARGHTLRELVGRRWRTAFDGAGDLILALATTGLLRFSGPILYYLLGHWPSNTGFLLPTTLPESVVWISVSAAAGAGEELVFRGYLQRQLWSLTKNLPVALLLQAFIFSIGHIYQGWKPALVTAIYGLVFGLVAAWRRSIVPGAIAHAVVDVMGGLMRPG